LNQDPFARLDALSTAFERATTPQAVAQALLGEGVRATGAHTAALVLLDKNLQMTLLGAGPDFPSLMMGQRVPQDVPGPLSICAWTGESVWLESLAVLRADYPDLDWSPMERGQIRAAACLPLHEDGRSRGAVCICFSRPMWFSEEERRTLRMIVAQCTEALDRTWLYLPFQQS